METNILRAIANIKDNSNFDLSKIYVFPKTNMSSVNRANNVGEALEYFMKDAFCNSFKESNAQKKKEFYSKVFSYLGNQNNPPDIILRNSDAIEVKKIDGVKSSDLALNSSYPKSKLFSNSSLITQACRECEKNWVEKDIIYSVGFVEDKNLKLLILVYGGCYCASPGVYEGIKNRLEEGIEKTNLEFSSTKELGRINRIDPLGITNLRIRGMWTIQNPLKVFSDIFKFEKDKSEFNLISLMKKEKYDSFPKEDREKLEKDKQIILRDVKIQNPDNPAKQINSKLIILKK
jgi:hypothetical protein